MDNIQENQEYINPQEYGSVPLNTQNFSLKPPKRLMSAYACFSRKVSPFLSPLTRRFNDVKATMPPQSKQSDIFREIAKKWKGMSPEEKQPYVNEVRLAPSCERRRTRTSSERRTRSSSTTGFGATSRRATRLAGTRCCG